MYRESLGKVNSSLYRYIRYRLEERIIINARISDMRARMSVCMRALGLVTPACVYHICACACIEYAYALVREIYGRT